MFAMRVLSMGISFLFVPFYLSKIETNEYGIMIALMSVTGWINSIDVGFGNGIRNKLTELNSSGNLGEVKTYVSSAYFGVFIYMLLILVVLLTLNRFISISQFIGLGTSRESEIRCIFDYLIIITGSNFVLGIFNTIMLSLHKTFIPSIINFITQLITAFTLIIAVKYYNDSSLRTLTLINALPPLMVLGLFSLLYFKFINPGYAPNKDHIKAKHIREILFVGSKFFVLQIITLILMNLTTFLIMKITGPQFVVKYNITTRYLELIWFVFGIIITPMWSSTKDAFVNHDFTWIKSTVNKLLILGVVMSFFGLLMVVVADFVFDFWLGKNIDFKITQREMFPVLFYYIFRMFYQIFGYVINASQKLNAQLKITLISAIFFVPFTVYFGNEFGYIGIIWVVAFFQLVNWIWARIQFSYIVNNSGSSFWHR